jgi:hypothetical protein
LWEELHYRVEKEISPGEVQVIDQMLKRGIELREAYAELCAKLLDHHRALKVFFDQLLSVAAHWNPDAHVQARQDRNRLVEINRKILDTASQLADQLTERSHLRNQSGFSCDTYYHPLDVIQAAAEPNYLYKTWVKERLQALRGQFDLKYWPSLEDCIRKIASDAAMATPEASDTLTAVGTEASRASLADTFKSFFLALEEVTVSKHGFLPNDFRLSDRSAASLLSCALDLDPDDVVDAGFVKRLRQRERERQD